MSMRRVLVVESQPELRSLLISVLSPSCNVIPIGDVASAEQILRHEALDAVIINMELPSAAIALARRATALGCGAILIPDLPWQFNAAAQAGYLILGKPFRCERLIELVNEACAHNPPTTDRRDGAAETSRARRTSARGR